VPTEPVPGGSPVLLPFMWHLACALRLFQRPLGPGWAPADGAPLRSCLFPALDRGPARAMHAADRGWGLAASGAGGRLVLPVCDAWRNVYLDRYTCTPHDAPGSRRAAILLGTRQCQHAAFAAHEDAGASSEWRCEHEASAACPGARSSHIAEETLHGVPPEATERGLLEQLSS
jgi:hypothetical protein